MPTYLDNAATSCPKPDSVYLAVERALKDIGATPGRGAHRLAREASTIVSEVRKKVARLFDIPDAERVVFTKNATESLNVALKGWLRAGDRVLLCGMEHNAVVRPLHTLKTLGVQVETVPGGPDGIVEIDALGRCMETPPRLVIATHASNVNGALQPVPEIAEECEKKGVPLLLDAAQTAGVQPISVKGWNLGMLACSGHKALLGPPGTGVLYIRPDLDVCPLIEGGTGSLSEEPVQPRFSPDRYESGTPNLVGVAGLGAGIDFIFDRSMDSIRKHELELADMLVDRLKSLSRIRVFEPRTRGTGVVSFTVEGLTSNDAAYMLDEVFDIAVRPGLHCAPVAHQTLGSFPEGAVRVSPGYATTVQEIDYFLQSMRMLLSRRR